MTIDLFDVMLLTEALFWVSVILSSPYLGSVAYRLSLPLWARLFPAKTMIIKYEFKGKIYKSKVSMDEDLALASAALVKLAENKHEY